MENHVTPVNRSESIGELLRGILADLSTLLREEMALARLEISQQLAQAKTAGISFGLAGAAILMGLMLLLVALALGAADLFEWPAWGGFLAVAVVMLVVGGIAFLAGRSQMSKFQAVPPHTMSTIKENAEWISKKLSSEQR
jgi:hypothetical protein